MVRPHDPSRFAEFRRRYLEELRAQVILISRLRKRAREGTVALVYAAMDTEHNDTEVVRRGLPSRRGRSR